MRLLVTVTVLYLVTSGVYSLSCDTPCNTTTCIPPPCAVGKVKDSCGCCDVCAKKAGEKCGGLLGVEGICDSSGFTCLKSGKSPEGGLDQRVGICKECQWKTITNNTVTYLSTNYPDAPACNDSIRIAIYEDQFKYCVESCQGKHDCEVVIGKQKFTDESHESQSSCYEFSSICTSIPCDDCDSGIDYAALCEVPGNVNNENSETSTDSANRNRDTSADTENGNNGARDAGNENNGHSGSDGKDKAGDADSQAMTIHGKTEFATFMCVLVYMIN